MFNADDGNKNSGAGNNPAGADDSKGGNNPAGEQPKTFTQEDVNRIAAREKQQGSASAYKELGFNSADEAKKAIEAWRKSDDDKKDEATKANEAKAAAEKATADANAKALTLERKLAAIEAGVDPKNADDVVTLASAKTNDSTTFEAALEAIKKSYPSMFKASAGDNNGGTGNNSNGARGGGGKAESLGKRLAEKRASSLPKENPYFK